MRVRGPLVKGRKRTNYKLRNNHPHAAALPKMCDHVHTMVQKDCTYVLSSEWVSGLWPNRHLRDRPVNRPLGNFILSVTTCNYPRKSI